jgi:hypothetical protein
MRKSADWVSANLAAARRVFAISGAFLCDAEMVARDEVHVFRRERCPEINALGAD